MQEERPACRGFAADFRVGDWLVEPSLDRLSRNGTVVRLRPQLVDVLVVLARHAGRTVSKDDILASVWESQHVAESCMTRCIAELRQALEDDARQPKVVQTIPKRGYRLVAPVEFLDSRRALALDALSQPSTESEAGSLPSESRPSDVPAGTAPPVLPVPASRLVRPYGWAGGTIAAVLLLIAGWGMGERTPASILSERDTVLLADMSNTTGDKAFDGTLRLALAVSLGQAPSMRILPNEQVRAALSRMLRPADQPLVGPVALEVCRREAATVLVAGSIARLGSHYAVGVEAIACASGETIDRELVEVGRKDEVLTALETAATRLRRALGESRESLRQHDVPLVRATTPSLDALKALSLGDYSRDHARLDDALTFYRRATELDPRFALAWARRGAAARNVSQFQESTPAFQKAYELRERVTEPERFYIMAHYYRFVADDPYKALETYQLWKRTYPGSAVPPTNLASLHLNLFGQLDAALVEGREAVRLAPYSSIAHGTLARTYLAMNKTREARQVLRDAANGGASDLIWHNLAFELAFTEGDVAGMEEQVRWAASHAGASMQMAQYRAAAAAAGGRLREARQLWAEAVATAAQIGPPAWQAGIKIQEAEAEALLGDPRRARAAADAALAIDPLPYTLMSSAIVLGMAGDVARANALLDRFAAHPPAALCNRRLWLLIAQSVIAAQSGQFERARETLRQVAPFERSREFELIPLAVRASIERSLGRPQDAAATYQDLLSRRRVAPMSFWIPVARLGLARSLRQQGDLAGSRAAYDTLIDCLKEADADAPLLIAARSEREALIAR